MSTFKIPERAMRELEVQLALSPEIVEPDPEPLGSPEGAEEAAQEPAEPLDEKPLGYGFICAECRCSVDAYVRGPHRYGCSNLACNQSLLPGAERYANWDPPRPE